jgi:hypothetical protein
MRIVACGQCPTGHCMTCADDGRRSRRRPSAMSPMFERTGARPRKALTRKKSQRREPLTAAENATLYPLMTYPHSSAQSARMQASLSSRAGMASWQTLIPWPRSIFTRHRATNAFERAGDQGSLDELVTTWPARTARGTRLVAARPGRTEGRRAKGQIETARPAKIRVDWRPR